MYICIWPDWFRENLHNGKKSIIYNFLFFTLYFKYDGDTLQTGPDGATEEQWGVNYRALNDLFRISQTRGNAFSYEITVQMVEIYNEQVRDLLSSDGSQKRYP